MNADMFWPKGTQSHIPYKLMLTLLRLLGFPLVHSHLFFFGGIFIIHLIVTRELLRHLWFIGSPLNPLPLSLKFLYYVPLFLFFFVTCKLRLVLN